MPVFLSQLAPDLPKKMPTPPENSFKACLAVACLLVLVIYGIQLPQALDGQLFSADSWAYFELAKSFATDIYRFDTLRSFWSDTYSAAFPLGYPGLLHGLHSILGETPRAGILINLLAALLTVPAAAMCARGLGGSRWTGVAAALMLLLYRPYIEEIFAARTIPLVILLDLMALTLLTGQRISIGKALLAGLIAGLGSLIRFDHLILQALMAALVLWRTRRILPVAGFAAGGLLGMLPWIEFSLIHFLSLIHI